MESVCGTMGLDYSKYGTIDYDKVQLECIFWWSEDVLRLMYMIYWQSESSVSCNLLVIFRYTSSTPILRGLYQVILLTSFFFFDFWPTIWSMMIMMKHSAKNNFRMDMGTTIQYHHFTSRTHALLNFKINTISFH